MVESAGKSRHPAPSDEASNPLSAAVLDQLQDALIATDLHGNVTACNKGVSLYGYVPGELIGKNISGLYRPEEQVFFARQVVPSVLEKGRFEGELRSRAKSGEDVYVHLSITLLRDSDSTPVGMLAFAIDITDKKLVEQAFESGASRTGNDLAPTPCEVARREIGGTVFVMASPIMHKFMGMVDRVAGHTETVLVVGETGSGKELVARTVHESSHRRNRPLVDINCAALPEHLVESELFGYEKGAFSGADASKPGLFELADKGTLFLDEIGELQTQAQVKLLRVLDGAPYYRLGGHRKITVDVRVVAATNQDLELAVKEGRFRKDLFHRLSQFQLRVPPLRERPEDIPALIDHFVGMWNRDLGRSVKGPNDRALELLMAYRWPGNVRELRNVIERAILLESEEWILPEHLPVEIVGAAGGSSAVIETMIRGETGIVTIAAAERMAIEKALEQAQGNKTKAAEWLGISRQTLRTKLKEYRIESGGPGD